MGTTLVPDATAAALDPVSSMDLCPIELAPK